MTAVVFQRSGVRVLVNGEPADISDAVLEMVEERAHRAHCDRIVSSTAANTADIVMRCADTFVGDSVLCVPACRPPNRAERRARRFGR